MHPLVLEIVDDGTDVEVHRNEPRAGNRNMRIKDGIECVDDFVDRQMTEARIRRIRNGISSSQRMQRTQGHHTRRK
jgi:hypothetical protein